MFDLELFLTKAYFKRVWRTGFTIGPSLAYYIFMMYLSFRFNHQYF